MQQRPVAAAEASMSQNGFPALDAFKDFLNSADAGSPGASPKSQKREAGKPQANETTNKQTGQDTATRQVSQAEPTDTIDKSEKKEKSNKEKQLDRQEKKENQPAPGPFAEADRFFKNIKSIDDLETGDTVFGMKDGSYTLSMVNGYQLNVKPDGSYNLTQGKGVSDNNGVKSVNTKNGVTTLEMHSGSKVIFNGSGPLQIFHPFVPGGEAGMHWQREF